MELGASKKEVAPQQLTVDDLMKLKSRLNELGPEKGTKIKLILEYPTVNGCPIEGCKKYDTTFKKIREHIKDKHGVNTDEILYYCATCKFNSTKKQHMTMHHDHCAGIYRITSPTGRAAEKKEAFIKKNQKQATQETESKEPQKTRHRSFNAANNKEKNMSPSSQRANTQSVTAKRSLVQTLDKELTSSQKNYKES